MPVAAPLLTTDLSSAGLRGMVCTDAIDAWASTLAAAETAYTAAVAGGVPATIRAAHRDLILKQQVQAELERACKHCELLGAPE